MTRSTPSSRLLWHSLAVLLVLHFTHAQLLSCTEIGCPVNSYTQSTCQVNGSRITTLGFTNFTTSLTTEPLSWTVGHKVGLPNINGKTIDERFYYLGTPPALDLNSISSLSGCALSFVGIQADLSFVPPGTSVPDMGQVSGTCGDALGATCVSDLTKQALGYTDGLASNGTFQCTSLADMLRDDPPASCLVAGITWGNIAVKDLIGPEAASKIELDTCHPTINQTYDIRIVGSQNSTSQYNFFEAITPILTVFAPASDSQGSSAGPVLSTSEVHLSCLKPVANKVTAGLVTTGDGSKTPCNSLQTWLLLGLSLWSLLW